MTETSSNESATIPTAISLVRDLMLGSRVTSAAKAVGRPILVVREPAKLCQRARERAPQAKLLVVDLNLEGAIPAAGQWLQETGGQAVGFVAHTDVETAERARQAGIARVMARSRFVEILPELLKSSD